MVGPTFAINSVVNLERDIKLAIEATWGILEKEPDAADDYDIWITVGQTLHDLDESLLDVWDEWSKTSDKYKDGECHKRWLSFSRGGGRTLLVPYCTSLKKLGGNRLRTIRFKVLMTTSLSIFRNYCRSWMKRPWE
jgi:hypothetical protein